MINNTGIVIYLKVINNSLKYSFMCYLPLLIVNEHTVSIIVVNVLYAEVL